MAAESGEKSNILREKTLLRHHTLRVQVNVSVLNKRKSSLLTPTPVRFPILIQEHLRNSLFALCYHNCLELRKLVGSEVATWGRDMLTAISNLNSNV